MRQCICYVILDTCNMLNFNMHVMSHCEEGEGVD